MNRVIPCPECSNPFAVGPTGWGRCRMCGHESLSDEGYSRDERAYVDASVRQSGAARLLGLSPLSTSEK